MRSRSKDRQKKTDKQKDRQSKDRQTKRPTNERPNLNVTSRNGYITVPGVTYNIYLSRDILGDSLRKVGCKLGCALIYCIIRCTKYFSFGSLFTLL